MSDLKYLAIIFLGGGSSWAYAPTIKKAADDAARILARDWGHLFNFEGPVPVNVYNVEDYDGHYSDHRGVFGTKSDEDEDTLLERKKLLYREVPAR